MFKLAPNTRILDGASDRFPLCSSMYMTTDEGHRTRHLMRLTWPYDKTDWDKYSHGAKWFGLNVEKKDIKAPSGSSQTLGRYSHGRAPVHRTVPKYY